MKLGIDMALRALVLGTLLVTSASAFAQLTATAQVSVSNIRYELIDLNPDDDIAPQLTWLNASTGSTAWVETQGGYYTDGTPAYGNGSLKNQESFGFDGVTAISGAGIDVSTSGEALNIRGQISGGSFVNADAYHTGYFSLTPDTAVTFSAQYEARLAVTVPPNLSALPGYKDWYDYKVISGADINFLVNGYDWSLLCCQTLSSLGASLTSHTDDQTSTQTLSRTFTNFGDLNQSFGVVIDVTLVAHTADSMVRIGVPAPIPESSSLTMTGLGLLGLTALRLKAKQARRA